MSVDVLPHEIIEIILKMLNGTEVTKCRRVCVRWRDAVDGLNEDFWKKTCEIEHNDAYKDAYRKACLSWRELYNSLCLWSTVSTSEVKIHKTPSMNAHTFHILQNCVMGYYDKTSEFCPDLYDNVIYYNLTTLRESHRDLYVFHIQNYEENDNILCVSYYKNNKRKPENFNIRVIPKANRGSFLEFGWMIFPDPSRPILLLENGIYFQTADTRISYAKLVERNNQVVLQSPDCVMSSRFPYHILEVVQVNSNCTNVFAVFDDLTIDSIICKITSLNDIGAIDMQIKDRVVSFVSTRTTNSAGPSNEDNQNKSKIIIKQLKTNGFKWSSKHILPFIQKTTKLSEVNIEAAYTFGKVVIVGSGQMIHIFYDPYDHNGDLDLFDKFPDKSIMLPTDEDTKNFVKIDVVESLNGHKIIVMFCYRIYVIELIHRGCDRQNIDYLL